MKYLHLFVRLLSSSSASQFQLENKETKFKFKSCKSTGIHLCKAIFPKSCMQKGVQDKKGSFPLMQV